MHFQNPYNAQQSQDCTNHLRIAQCMCYNTCVIDSYSARWVRMWPVKMDGNNVRECIRAICTTVGDTLAAQDSTRK